jgi:excisionase family DNA binding protein
MSTTAEPEFMSVSETALKLGVGAATVRRWVRTGVIHGTQPAGAGGVLRIPTTELERLERGE